MSVTRNNHYVPQWYQEGFGKEVMAAHVVESASQLRVAAQIGERAPLHCTSAGKLFLALDATCPSGEILSEPLAAVAPKTTTTRAKLEKQISALRKTGYAIDDEELPPYARSVAAPILGPGGTIVAALSVIGPSVRLSMAHLAALAPSVVASASAIGRDLGGSS